MLNRAKMMCVAGFALAMASLSGAERLHADFNTERRIDMYNIHNGETISIVYKKDGEYIPDALEKLNWFMRDWRINKPTKMDPHTIDIVWEIHEELGSKEPIHFVSGYRSPATNEALRRAGGGQAKHSQHILGKAMDVAFPDVPVQKLRYAGLVRQLGGVGYYPTSGVPFVHIDTGNVRMWPRMPRYELALLFPNGKSKYVPADGRPISMADVTYARAHYTQMAEAIAAFHQFRAEAKDRTLVASMDQQTQTQWIENPNNPDDDNHDAAGPGETDAAAPVEQASVQVPAKPARSKKPAPQQVAEADVAASKPADPATADAASADAPSDAPTQAADTSAATDSDPPSLDGPALLPAAPQAPAAVAVSAPAAKPKPMMAKVKLASLTDMIVPPKPQAAIRPAASKAAPALPIEATVNAPAAGDPTDADPMETIQPPEPVPVSDIGAFLNKAGWVSAPSYDDDHDSELVYRPFSMASLISEGASIDAPALAKLTRPSLKAAWDSIGDSDEMGMQFRPDLKVAELMWSDSFSGQGGVLPAENEGKDAPVGRLVQTASR